MTSKMAALKAAGQPLPTSIEEVEQKLGECADLIAASKYKRTDGYIYTLTVGGICKAVG